MRRDSRLFLFQFIQCFINRHYSWQVYQRKYSGMLGKKSFQLPLWKKRTTKTVYVLIKVAFGRCEGVCVYSSASRSSSGRGSFQ